MPIPQITECPTHGKQGWHALMCAQCVDCAHMVAMMLMMCAWALQGKARMMKEAGYQVGSAQPEAILCPEGHVMIITGKGSVSLSVVCNAQGCPHKGVKFQAVLPMVELRPISSEQQPVEASAEVEGRLACGCVRDPQKLRCGFTDMCLDHCPCHKNFIPKDSVPAGVPGAE